MFSTVENMLHWWNGHINACKEMLHFETIWKQWCLVLPDRKKYILFLIWAEAFFFCTQDTGDIKINELNSGSVEKLKECLFSCCLHAT